jgi:hypothetical protein
MNEMIEAFVNNKLNYCGGGCLGGVGGWRSTWFCAKARNNL